MNLSLAPVLARVGYYALTLIARKMAHFAPFSKGLWAAVAVLMLRILRHPTNSV